MFLYTHIFLFQRHHHHSIINIMCIPFVYHGGIPYIERFCSNYSNFYVYFSYLLFFAFFLSFVHYFHLYCTWWRSQNLSSMRFFIITLFFFCVLLLGYVISVWLFCFKNKFGGKLGVLFGKWMGNFKENFLRFLIWIVCVNLRIYNLFL